MGEIQKFMQKIVCKETAVYWGNPVSNGVGGFTYDTPREIMVRWDGSTKVITDRTGVQIARTGVQIACRAQVMVLEDLDELGVLCLNTIDDLINDGYLEGDLSDPSDVPDAYVIHQFNKNPMIGSTTDFFRQAFLGVR